MFSVQGKRKRNATTKKRDAKPSPRRGRPMKPAKELSISKAAVKKRLKYQVDTMMLPSDNLLSLLEQLPNELIQQIFFHCFEVNLPRASLRLAQALSTESTYKALILFAFFDDDGVRPVETKLFLPVAYTRLEPDVRIRLQGDVLMCRWFNLERLRNAMPALSILAMTQEWHEEHDLEMMLMRPYTAKVQAKDILAGQSENTSTPINLDVLQGLAILPELEDLDGICKHFFAKTCHKKLSDTEEDTVLYAVANSEKYLPRIVTWTVHLKKPQSEEPYLTKGPTFVRSVLATRTLPDRLVKGNPWTSERIEMLQLLRQGSRFSHAYIDSFLYVSASAMFDGMISAIKESNEIALMTLLEIRNDVFEDENFVRDMSANRKFRIPARVFHAAIRAGAQSSKFVCLLLRANLTSLPKDDNVLTAWALKEQAKGDRVADLVLDYMSSPTDHYIDKFKFKDDVVGPNTEGMPFLREERRKTFHKELGYLPGCLPTRHLGSYTLD